jgi:outer membrane protein TolC
MTTCDRQPDPRFGFEARTQARCPRATITAAVLCGLLIAPASARAQSALAVQASPPAGQPYTLDEAVAAALAHHPRLAGAAARQDAAAARVDEARSGFLPLAGLSAQLNRSTGNTPPGTFFPTTGFPAISGPALGRTLDAGTWQTGVSAWAAWDLLSFSRQAAAVDVTLAGSTQAEAATAARRLEVAYGAADAFLRLLEADQAVKAAQASVDRAQVFAAMVKPLVDQSLRPGVDIARADAELSVALTQLARAEQTREVARAQLAEAMGSTDVRVTPVPGALLGPIGPSEPPPARSPDRHPFVQERAAAVAMAEQVKRRVEVQYLPRFDLVAAAWLRGSGLYGSPADGLAPDIPNWAAGAVVTWSVLDIPTIRSRASAAAADQASASAQRDETYLAVVSELRSASALLQGATRIAGNTPHALASARAAEQQAVARYQAALAPAVDVADAERLLAQAELDDALARIEVRRAELLLARAAGDLGPFLASARGA